MTKRVVNAVLIESYVMANCSNCGRVSELRPYGEEGLLVCFSCALSALWARENEMGSDFIDEMVDNFLGWKLPKDFNPDGGVSFDPEYNAEYMAQIGKPPMRYEPTGTNLFDANQAREMIEYIITGSNRFTENRKSIEAVKAMKRGNV